MKWKKFKIKTVTEAEDIIISTLYDIGLEGAQIEDKVPLTAMEKEQMPKKMKLTQKLAALLFAALITLPAVAQEKQDMLCTSLPRFSLRACCKASTSGGSSSTAMTFGICSSSR